jgi:hypothetical protein
MSNGEQHDDEDAVEAAMAHDDPMWRMIIGQQLAQVIDGLAVLCGEEFLTHDEHQLILDTMEQGAQRVVDHEIEGLLEDPK